MEIKFTSLHHVDHHLNSVKDIDINEQSDDLIDYTNRLITEITQSSNKRRFEFKSDTTEVRTAIKKFLESDYKDGSTINAVRLLDVEKKAQEQINHLDVEIQKGSLFQSVLLNNNDITVIISKADHSQFLDESDFELKNGLPWEKRVFKAFLVNFQDNLPLEIFVYDTTHRMARYWWDDYLELVEKHTDRHNTKRSLDILDQKVFNGIKKIYPADHTIIRNAAIGYYRNNDDFIMDNFIEQTLTNYTPVDPDFPRDKIISKVKNLPQKWDFDTRFTIQKEEINKRKVNKIPLTDNIELVLKDYIDNFNDIIKAEIDAEGNKFIKIKSDAGYDRFRKS